MGKKKEAKLTFIPVVEDLKEIAVNTIPQVVTSFSYVQRWANIKNLKDDLPDDYNNVINFFKDIQKLSPHGFQAKKFKDLWVKYNMSDITDYELIAQGVDTSTSNSEADN